MRLPRLSPTIRFCALLAALAVGLRVLVFDHVFFRLLHIPSHDMSQGLAFFATSMHSMRLAGDLAWWSPASVSGYAQYFQGFFSPLAPTWGHVVFIAWAQLVGLAAKLGLAIPEYYQYLAVNYLVLPFLAFLAFGYFCSLFVKRPEAVVLAVAGYVLSGIGLWNSAWFHFQEAFSVFFLLGTTVALMQRPGRGRLFAWLAAVLVQVASINYWTLYNMFFVMIVLGAYAATHRNQVLRLAARMRSMVSADRRGMALVLGGFALTALAWTALVVLVMLEQSGNYVRWIYSAQNAVAAIPEIRRNTIELFNPSLERALAEPLGIFNPIHYARYLGASLLPLVAIGVLAARQRRGRWLLCVAVLLFAVSVGAPPFVQLWSAIPFMDRIQHVFYFYSHHWQVAVLLLGAVGLDRLLGPLSSPSRRMARWILAIGAIVAALAGLLGALRTALFLGLTCALLYRAVAAMRAREMRLAAAAVVFLLLVDLSWYFHSASSADVTFTAARRNWTGQTPSSGERAILSSAWGPPRPEQGFRAGLDGYLPLTNNFWPVNNFMLPAELSFQFGPASTLANFARSSAPVAFYAGALTLADQRKVPASFLENPDGKLIISGPAGAAPTGSASLRVSEGFSYRITRWLYNEFDLEVTVPSDGWLMVRQHYDPNWRVVMDGSQTRPVQANYVSMALPVATGTHSLGWGYRPWSRRLYWIAALLLEAMLAALLVLALRSSPPTVRR